MKALRNLPALIILSIHVTDCAEAADKPEAPGLSSETRELLTEVLEESGLPGLAIAVADDKRILEAGAAGIARTGHDRAISQTNRFHIGSISKAVTSTAAGVLVDQGVFDWSSKIREIAPDLTEGARPEYDAITVRQLLSHTAGIQPFEEDEEFDRVPVTEGTPREQRRAFAKHLLTLEPTAQPGTTHVYSNAGYTVLAAVIEHLFQEDFDVIVRRLVFVPLRMESAGIGPPSLHDANEPWGHARSGTAWLDTEPNHGSRIRELILPAGDFHMTLADLARLGSAHLRALNGEPSILASSTALEIHSEVMDGYGLGWNIRKSANFHMGGLEGMHTAVLLILKSEMKVIVIATNAEAEDMAVFNRLIAALRN